MAMKFERVVSVVAPRWENAAKTVNAIAGRSLFAETIDESTNEIERQVCGGVLYLALALSSPRPIAETSDSSAFSTCVKQEVNTLRRLMFIFLSSHVVVWVNEDCAVSLQLFRSLTALNGSKAKVTQALAQSKQAQRLLSKRGWPGKCQPYLVLGFLQPGDVEARQRLVGDMLKACDITNTSGRSGAICRLRSNICVTLETDLTMKSGPTKLAKLIQGFNAQVEEFSNSDWVGAASLLVNVLKLSDRGGLVGGLGSGQLDLKQPRKGVSSGKSSSSKSQNTPSMNAVNRLESFVRLEEQFSRQLCEKGIPFALEAYTRGLAPAYNSKVHTAHVKLALSEFRSFTGLKGVFSRRQEKKIEEQCHRIWRGAASLVPSSKNGGRETCSMLVATEKSRIKANDRRLCDSVSFSGHPCTLLYRDCLSLKANDPLTTVLDLTKCSSGVRETLACSCGRSILDREDPFDSFAANVSSVTRSCCLALPSVDLSFEREQLSGDQNLSAETGNHRSNHRGGRKKGKKKQPKPEGGGADDGFCGAVDGVPRELILQTRPADTTALTKQVTFSIPEERRSDQLEASSRQVKVPHRRKRKGDTSSRGGGAWVVHKLGSASDYNPGGGIPLDRFVQGYNRFEAWAEHPIHVGLEYECIATGARQFFAVSSLMAPPPLSTGTMSSDESAARVGGLGDGSLWPEFDIDVFLANDQSVSQLQRVFVCVGTLETNRRVRIQAEVHFDSFRNMSNKEDEAKTDVERFPVFSHRPLDLPGNTLVCMCLPHVYIDKETEIPLLQPKPVAGQRFRSAARLKAGLIQVL